MNEIIQKHEKMVMQYLSARGKGGEIEKYGLGFLSQVETANRSTIVSLGLRQRYYLYELNRLLVAFEKENVPMLVLKGLPLTYEIYGDIDSRFSGDIDILCEPEYFVQSFRIICESGYRYSGKVFEFTDYESFRVNDPYASHNYNHVKEFVNEKSKINIRLEMHLYPFAKTDFDYGYEPYMGINTKDFFIDMRKITISGLTVNVLSVEKQLIQLMCHFTTHFIEGIRIFYQGRNTGYANLKALMHLSMYLNKVAHIVDWDHLIQLCKNWGILFDVVFCAKLQMEVFGQQTPLCMIDDVGPPVEKEPVDKYRKLLYRATSELTWEQIAIENLDFYFMHESSPIIHY